MSQYDYLGEYQVKCFMEPCISFLKKDFVFETKEKKYNINKTIPFQNLIYNYGYNFIILDFQNSKEVFAHIIKLGKYKGTVRFFKSINEIKYTIDNYSLLPNFSPVVIDKYGAILKCNKKEDIISFLNEYIICCNMYSKLYKEKIIDKNLNISFEEWAAIPKEELKEKINLLEKIENSIRDETLNKFYKKWKYSCNDIEYQKRHDSTLIGSVLSYLTLENCSNEDKETVILKLKKYYSENNIDIIEEFKKYEKFNSSFSLETLKEIFTT